MELRVPVRVCMAVVLALTAQLAHGFCWEQAGQKYGIDPMMLKAIAMTESGLNPKIESPTSDIGLMGINRWWLPKLAQRGLSEQDVWEPCTNVHVGAWILQGNYRVLGKNWNAVGAYAAACSKLKGAACRRARTDYAQKVYRNWLSLQKK